MMGSGQAPSSSAGLAENCVQRKSLKLQIGASMERYVFFCSKTVGVDGGGFWKPVN
jgi:hypothetical protein